MQTERWRAGRWELVRPLGRGGMGEVWLARDPARGEEVALKRLPPGALDPAHQARFQREAEALERLRHPAVVRWIESGTDERGPWLAAELCPGGSLKELAAAGTLPVERAVELARDLAGALGAAHRAGLVHRDVKPSNALLDREGRVRLADFGLARPLERGGSLTETGTVMGSPGYLAPEQVMGEKELIGPATDVYGLGATLYYLLTGRAPFAGTSVVAGLDAVLRKTPPPPSAHRPEVPAILDRIVLRCLAKSPAERYPSMEALRAGLEGWRVGKERPSRRALAFALVLLGLVAAGGVLVIRPPGRTTAHQRGIAHRNEGRLAEALVELDRAVAEDPGVAQVWFDRGSVHAGADRWEAALPDFDRAVELDPGHALAWAFAGAAHRMQGDLTGALTRLGRAVELDPRRKKTREHRVAALVQLEQWEQALLDLDEILVQDPEDLKARGARATVLCELGRWRDAIRDYEAIIARAPDARAWFMKAQVHLALGELREAVEGHDRALQLGLPAPQADLARRSMEAARARLLAAEQMRAGRWAEAIDLFDQALAAAPHDARALHQRGVAWRELGDGDRALADLDRSIELDSRVAEVWFDRGIVWFRVAQWDRSLPDFDRALELDPVHVRALLHRGLARSSLEDRAGALSDLDRAVELDPRSGQGQWNRGRVFARLGELEKALADFDAAVALAPRQLLILMDRASLLGTLGRFEEAIADLDQVIARDPGVASAYHLRGLARTNLDQLQEALADYDRALELGLDGPAAEDAQQRREEARNRLAEGGGQ